MSGRTHPGCPNYEPDDSAVFGTCRRSGHAVHRWSRCEFPPESLGPTLFDVSEDVRAGDDDEAPLVTASGVRRLGAMSIHQLGDILQQTCTDSGAWTSTCQPIGSDETMLTSLTNANIAWPNMMPVDRDEPDVWVLAVTCEPATAFADRFWGEAQWSVVPRAGIPAFGQQTVADGLEARVAWVVWGTPAIESEKPFGFLPALHVDLDYEGYEPPDMDEAAADIFEWIVAMQSRFPRQDINLELTGGKGVHLVLEEWDASAFTYEENPLVVYSEFRRALLPKMNVFNPDPVHQLHRLTNTLYGYATAKPWMTSVVRATGMGVGDIKRELTRAWSSSGYWAERSKEAERD